MGTCASGVGATDYDYDYEEARSYDGLSIQEW